MTVHVKRLVALAVGVTTVVILGSSKLGAQGKEAQGAVTAISSSSITITSAGKPMTFVIDKETKLEDKAAARKSRDAKTASAPGPQITDYIKVGNPVLVRYNEANGGNHALFVRQVSSPGEASEPHAAVKTASGTVKAVSLSQVTLSSDGKDMTFAINRDTDVLARGATKTTKAAGGTTTIGDFVHNGDDVSISYVDNGGTMTASQVRVRVAKK
ncbi:MAG TPA: DUF5666 domain-containing protein [Vicinamibacterales bacterium]